MKRPYLLIGACQRAHGVKGEVLVKSLTDDPDRFIPGLICYAMDETGESPVRQLTLSGCRPTPQGFLLSFDGIETRDAARLLTGSRLAVKREDAVPLADSFEFYYGDLIGAGVFDKEKGDLGSITDIIRAGNGDILVVSREGEKDLLIPFLRSIIQKVDIGSGRIDLCLPDGLYPLYRQASETSQGE